MKTIFFPTMLVYFMIVSSQAASALSESFEQDDALVHWSADDHSSIAVTGETYRSGKHSLRWSWRKDQSVLTFASPEEGTFAKRNSTFTLFIYNPSPIKDSKLQFEIGTAQETQSRFDFGLDFKGWRCLHFLYQKDLSSAPNAAADTLRIISPKSVPEGSLYFDLFDTATPYEGQHAGDVQMPWVASVAAGQPVNHWMRFYYNDQRPYPFEPFTERDITADMRESLGLLTDRFLPRRSAQETGISDKRYRETLRIVDTFGIKRQGSFINGRPVFYGYFVSRLGEEDIRVTQRKDRGIGYLQTMHRVALDYRAAKDPERRSRLKETCFLLCDYLAEQGWCHGSTAVPSPHHLGYGLREWPRTIALMRDELRATGRYEKQVKALQWFSNFGNVRGERPHGNADFYNTVLRGVCMVAALTDDPVQKANDFRSISRFLGESLFNGVTDADGSMYHHAMVHPGYTYAAINNLVWAVQAFSKTPFRIPAKGHARIKQMVTVMTQTAWPATPRSIAHRCIGIGPFRAEQNTLSIALAGTPDGSLDVDPDMAGLYLAVMARQGKENEHTQEFVQQGIAPAELTGHYRLANAVFSMHKRDNWKMAVGGVNKYYRGNEFYGWTWSRHCLARHLNKGNIQVITEKEPQVPTDGWDHNHWPGTTTPRLSAEELYAYYGAMKSSSTLGGNVASARNGVWGMELACDARTRGYKSAFFFDDHIVFLGSGLSSKNNGRLHTTIMQNKLSDGTESFAVGGATLPFPSQQTYTKPGYLLGDRRIAYYIPQGNDPLTVKRGEQETTYALPAEYKPGKDAFNKTAKYVRRQLDLGVFDMTDFNVTKGNYNLAYFDHGDNTQDAKYEFAMLVDATAEGAAAFTESPAYEVLQHDDTAHIVRHDCGDTGYAVFKADAPLNCDIRKSNRPVFILDEVRGDARTLYIASSERDRPDPIVLEIAVRFAEIQGGKILSTDATTTTIEVPFVHSVVIPVRLN